MSAAGWGGKTTARPLGSGWKVRNCLRLPISSRPDAATNCKCSWLRPWRAVRLPSGIGGTWPGLRGGHGGQPAGSFYLDRQLLVMFWLCSCPGPLPQSQPAFRSAWLSS